LAEGICSLGCDRPVFAGLLALMSASGASDMLDYVRDKLTRDPGLARERYSGRTLLHGASAAGNLATVELLLRLGADPNAVDGGGHTPLYSLGNECRVAGAGNVVRALVRSGAKVDARDGVKHCTALHMAARRGSVEAAGPPFGLRGGYRVARQPGDTPRGAPSIAIRPAWLLYSSPAGPI
jgi:hypothetical protein